MKRLVLGSALAIGLVGGCQLWLPSGDDDGRTSSTGAQGGAAASTHAASSGKTSSAKTSVSGSDVSATATGSTDQASVASTGSGEACSPAGVACNGLTALALPKLCASQVSCDANVACTQYCSAMFSLCPDQYLEPEVCCSECEHIQQLGGTQQCCHVNALNDVAAGNATQFSCTVAGPFGSESMDANTCGTQAANLCTIYEAKCPTQAVTCTKALCKSYLAGRSPVVYGAGSDPGATLSRLMDSLLGPDIDKCTLASAEFCGTMQ